MIYKLLWSFFFIIQWHCHVYGIPPAANINKRIDLSNNGWDNEQFFSVFLHHISYPEKVEELILRGNRLYKYIDCITNFNGLKTLDLSRNLLTGFHFLCKEDYNLTTLNISHNQIRYLGEDALTHRVMKLVTLDASYNDLFVINDTMLQHMKNLEWLSLASNPIYENIDEYVFQNITKLKHLNLRNISSPYFAPKLFEALTSLEYLDLSDNPIEEVPPLPQSIKVLYIGGTNIAQLNYLVMPQLRLLNLDYSFNLTSIRINDFENLTLLEELSIQKSPNFVEIRYSHMNPAFMLPNLKRLYLQNSGLQNLNSGLAPLIQKTAIVELQHNPWNCDCNMKWIASLNMTTDLMHSFKCQSPAQFHGKLLHDIPSDLICERSGDPGRLFITLFWICLVLALFGLFVSGIVYLSRNCLGKWAMKIRHRGVDTVRYDNVINENDLVRILPNQNPDSYEPMEI